MNLSKVIHNSTGFEPGIYQMTHCATAEVQKGLLFIIYNYDVILLTQQVSTCLQLDNWTTVQQATVLYTQYVGCNN